MAATSASWLTVTPTSGTTPGSLSVGIDTSGLTAGNYTGTVTVKAAGAANSPQTVSVTLRVSNQGTGQLIATLKTLSSSSESESERDDGPAALSKP